MHHRYNDLRVAPSLAYHRSFLGLRAKVAFGRCHTPMLKLNHSCLWVLALYAHRYQDLCVTPSAAYPVDPAGGTTLSMGDDTTEAVTIGFPFTFFDKDYRCVTALPVAAQIILSLMMPIYTVNMARPVVPGVRTPYVR